MLTDTGGIETFIFRRTLNGIQALKDNYTAVGDEKTDEINSYGYTLWGDKMEKVYSRINWENYPSTVSPINEVNLNKIDTALDTTDTRIVTFDTTKANQTDLLLCVESISYNSTTGVFLFTWQNGTTLSVDLNIEKIPVSFTMSEAGVITMINADGTTYTCDVGALIHQYNFIDSDQLDFTATLQEDGSYSVTAIIKAGSITDAMLEPTYLSTIQAYVASALASATSSRSYAVGGTASRTGEDTRQFKILQRTGASIQGIC